MFKELEILENWYDKGYITLKEYYSIKEKIIDKGGDKNDIQETTEINKTI